MDISTVQRDSVCILHISGRIDTLTSRAFGEQLTSLIGNGTHRLVIDLSQVAYISSAGFRSLLVAARAIESAKGQLALAGVNGEIKRLFDIAALTEFFPMWPTADEAAAKLDGSAADDSGSSNAS
jgi:anti-sigma B factor antagonist